MNVGCWWACIQQRLSRCDKDWLWSVTFFCHVSVVHVLILVMWLLASELEFGPLRTNKKIEWRPPEGGGVEEGRNLYFKVIFLRLCSLDNLPKNRLDSMLCKNTVFWAPRGTYGIRICLERPPHSFCVFQIHIKIQEPLLFEEKRLVYVVNFYQEPVLPSLWHWADSLLLQNIF